MFGNAPDREAEVAESASALIQVPSRLDNLVFRLFSRNGHSRNLAFWYDAMSTSTQMFYSLFSMRACP